MRTRLAKQRRGHPGRRSPRLDCLVRPGRVAGEQQRTARGRLDEQADVAGGVTGKVESDDRAVAEHVAPGAERERVERRLQCDFREVVDEREPLLDVIRNQLGQEAFEHGAQARARGAHRAPRRAAAYDARRREIAQRGDVVGVEVRDDNVAHVTYGPTPSRAELLPRRLLQFHVHRRHPRVQRFGPRLRVAT